MNITDADRLDFLESNELNVSSMIYTINNDSQKFRVWFLGKHGIKSNTYGSIRAAIDAAILKEREKNG